LDKILIEQYLLQHDLTSLDFSGVETTLCLIQAALAWCENPDSLSLPLTFSSAIIRFLNLTSHVGFNKFGLTKIHEVAEKFNIPGEKKQTIILNALICLFVIHNFISTIDYSTF